MKYLLFDSLKNQLPLSLLSPLHWKDYQLLDSGNYKKLEKFGSVITSRPEPQAVWQPSLSETEWTKKATAVFQKEKAHDLIGEKGNWNIKDGTPPHWFIEYPLPSTNLKFRLGFSSFKHVGIFPEQAVNWDFIHKQLSAIKDNSKNVLNLFAYTGGASLAASSAGAVVSHVDSVKQVISWTRENMEASGLKNIKWVVEDALKFVKREVKRGNKYNGIILDPPAYGRGPEGEKWIIEDLLFEMIKLCKELLKEKESFLILNLYSIGFSALIVETLLNQVFSTPSTLEIGELFLQDSFHKKLPLGVFGRFYQ